MKTGMYSSIPEHVYHADLCETPSASASILSTLYQTSPLHAWTAHPKLNPKYEPRKESDEQTFGRAVHSLLLGGPRLYPIAARDFKTKEAKGQRDAARAAGHIPLLQHRAAAAVEIAESLKAGLEKHELGNVFAEEGHPEATMIWHEDNKPLRGRCDWWMPKRKLIVDLKTTSGSASPDQWSRNLFNLGSDFQDVLYREGVAKALGLGKLPEFVFLVVETSAPFAFTVIRLSDTAREVAQSKVSQAWAAWCHCLDANKWPGYPTAICTAEVPAWHAREIAEKDALDLTKGTLLQ